MNLNCYKIQISKKNKEFLDFFRYNLLEKEVTIMPKSVSFSKDFSEIMPEELLAKRLGLINFLPISNEFLEDTKYTYNFENPLQAQKRIYSKDFNNKDLQAIVPEELVFILPAKTDIQLELFFQKGSATESARFSRIEGLRLSQDEHNLYVLFEILNDTFSLKPHGYESVEIKCLEE